MFPEPEQSIVKGQLATQMVSIISQRLLETKDAKRVLVCEMLTNNERAQKWILAGSDPAGLVEIMKESEFFGMQTFDQSLFKLVVADVIDLPVALPYARNVHEMRAKAMSAGIEI